MEQDWEFDREAIASVHIDHHRLEVAKLVESGQLTQRQADGVVKHFASCPALQHMVDADIERLKAFLSGQVH